MAKNSALVCPFLSDAVRLRARLLGIILISRNSANKCWSVNSLGGTRFMRVIGSAFMLFASGVTKWELPQVCHSGPDIASVDHPPNPRHLPTLLLTVTVEVLAGMTGFARCGHKIMLWFL